MSASPPLFVVLAAGKGTRMKSSLPKVLHKVAGQSMLAHVLDDGIAHRGRQIAVVAGPQMDAVGTEAVRVVPGARMFEQSAQLGTADAVLAARPALDAGWRRCRRSLCRYAADPRRTSSSALRKALDSGANIAVLGFRPKDPTGYGRLADRRSWRADCDPRGTGRDRSRAPNCSLQFGRHGVPGSETLRTSVADRQRQRERRILSDRRDRDCAQQGLKATVVECDESDVLGVNAREQLAVAEAFGRRAPVWLSCATASR